MFEVIAEGTADEEGNVEWDWIDQEEEGPACSICDALGHGYPGGGPCPLEERAWDDGFDEWERDRGVRDLDPQW
jgi:hypothetical protein